MFGMVGRTASQLYLRTLFNLFLSPPPSGVSGGGSGLSFSIRSRGFGPEPGGGWVILILILILTLSTAGPWCPGESGQVLGPSNEQSKQYPAFTHHWILSDFRAWMSNEQSRPVQSLHCSINSFRFLGFLRLRSRGPPGGPRRPREGPRRALGGLPGSPRNSPGPGQKT